MDMIPARIGPGEMAEQTWKNELLQYQRESSHGITSEGCGARIG